MAPINPRLMNLYRNTINILIYVANEIEYSNTLQVLVNPLEIIENGLIYHIGTIGKYKVLLIKGASLGMTRPGSICQILQKAFASFPNIQYLITIGVCGSLSSKVNKGDVIVANEIVDYESVKVDKKIIDRSLPLLSDYTGNKIDSTISNIKFDDFKVMHGKVLSGNKLVNNAHYVKYLKNLHNEALAVDMEGYELAKFAITNKLKPWIFIKSASDNAKNKKGNENQDICVRHALLVLEKIFSVENIFDNIRPKVLISGSFVFDNEKTFEAEKTAYLLTKTLINKKYKVVSGYGKCIGNAVVAGAYDSCDYTKQEKSMQEIIEVYPFPRITEPNIISSLNIIKTENRHSMAKGCVFSIFLYGIKDDDKEATGMNDEFQIANDNQSFLLPLGFTGYKAQELWNKINNEFDSYYPYNDKIFHYYFEKLKNNNEMIENINNVMAFLEYINNKWVP